MVEKREKKNIEMAIWNSALWGPVSMGRALDKHEVNIWN
jgi:hypothetical protein